jgi:hypothetical protein
MAKKLLAGWSFVRIAEWLNDTGALTQRDRARIAKGEEPKPRPWVVSVVIEALTSPRTQGIKAHKGVVVLDGDGEPVRLAPATFDPDTWQQIQHAVAIRRMSQRTPTGSLNPMLGVGICGCPGCDACAGAPRRNGASICGAVLTQQVRRRELKDGTTNEHRYYRCGGTPLNCRGVRMRANDADLLLEETFLARWGDEPVTRRVFVEGDDHSHELAKVNETIARLRMESDAGLLTTDEDTRAWLARLKAQTAKRDELAAKPARASVWVTEETDQVYREVWADSDQRQLLIDKGIRFVLYSGNPINAEMFSPEDGQPLPLG